MRERGREELLEEGFLESGFVLESEVIRGFREDVVGGERVGVHYREGVNELKTKNLIRNFLIVGGFGFMRKNKELGRINDLSR